MKNINEILAIGNENFTTRNSFGASLYKNELFVDCNGDALKKKRLRGKLRAKLDKFISEFVTVERNAEKLKTLAKDWNAYAKIVYTDVTKICDSNADQNKQATAKRFIAAMEKYKPNATKKVTTKKIVTKVEKNSTENNTIETK